MSVSVLQVIVPADAPQASAVCAWCKMGISLSAGHVLVGTDNTDKNLHEEPCYRNCTNYNAMVQRINKMDGDEIDELIRAGRCPFEPEHLVPMPLGMFHCDLCGEMVVAGCKHGRDS